MSMTNHGSMSPTLATTAIALVMLVPTPATAQVELVKDIYPGTTIEGAISPMEFVVSGGQVVFRSLYSGYGESLWRTDGTAGGTTCIWSGELAYWYQLLGGLTDVGGTVYFVNRDQAHGDELWRTDGSTDGTTLVKDLWPGPSPSEPRYLQEVNGRLYFTAADGNWDHRQLWVSDGTPEGTQAVTDDLVWIYGAFADLGGSLYFAGYTPKTGEELWRWDGLHTTLIADLEPGPESSLPQWLTVVGDSLYFAARTASTGEELWVSDGTTQGTHIVRDICAGAGDSSPTLLTPLGELLLFAADYRQVWRTDGTEAGTVQLTTPDPYTGFLYSSELTRVGDKVVFAGWDFVSGDELWVSDGTPEGTALVMDIFPGPYNHSDPGWLHAVGEVAYFQAQDGVHGFELWRTDGTPAGTAMVQDLDPGVGSSQPEQFTEFAGGVLFSARTAASERELWWSDIASGATAMVLDYEAPYSSSPGVSIGNAYDGCAVTDALCCAATDSDGGRELWRSDGTKAGTSRVADLLPGPEPSNPDSLYALGNKVLFGATAYPGHQSLWVTDGTTAGTTELRWVDPLYFFRGPDISGTSTFAFFPGSTGSGWKLWRTDGTEAGTWKIWDLSTSQKGKFLGETYLFCADDGTHGTELWRSDGSEAGTLLVRDIAPGGASGFSCGLSVLGDAVFFEASSSPSYPGNHELWRSDGTSEGTWRVKEFGSSLRSMAALGDTLIFSVDDGETGFELWRSDGTSGGTVLFQDIRPGQDSSDPRFFGLVGSTLLYRADDGLHGRELWAVTLGQEGAYLVADLYPGPETSWQVVVGELDGALLFNADDGVHGRELWRTDGTTAGTVLVADLWPGDGWGDPAAGLVDGGRLWFVATHGVFGRELFVSDGTPSGTHLVADLSRGQASSDITVLGAAGRWIFLSATDLDHGGELWRVDRGYLFADGFDSADTSAWRSAPE